MTPVGCWQCELILGDRQTGQTTIALDTVLTKKKMVTLLYVCVYSQEKSTVSRVIKMFKQKRAFDSTFVVSANSSDPATLQYLAPYSGCTIGE
jgi:F-type H+-transporting ATPase subunit alpha